MSQSSLKQPSRDSLKNSKLLAFSDKLTDFLSLFMRIGIFLCLIGSISFVFYSSFSTQTRRFEIFQLAVGTRNRLSEFNEPTNISHILFGIGASVHTWPQRKRYSKLWWGHNSTRGFVWLDRKPEQNISVHYSSIPYRISEDCTRFKYVHSASAVRIARIVLESYRLGLPNVRWFVMGDDDTVFFTHNLVSVLAKYDHNQMYYIGGNSESVEQDTMHSYDMAFGGGGFAVSYTLAAELVKLLDGCLDRYYNLYGSDQRIWACVSEIGVSLTKERGFHQLDIREDPYGLLGAHPVAPLVSLHHLDYLKPMFPNQTHIDSLKSLMNAYWVDPARILQQSFCYDFKRKWSISIAWGYTVQIYPSLLRTTDLQTPLQTFKTWRSRSKGPFTFNTRPVSSDPCERPVVYFLERVEKVGGRGSETIYRRFVEKGEKVCGKEDYLRSMGVKRVSVSSLKLDIHHWEKLHEQAPRRQCCEMMDHGSIKKDNLHLRIRKCRRSESITV